MTIYLPPIFLPYLPLCFLSLLGMIALSLLVASLTYQLFLFSL